MECSVQAGALVQPRWRDMSGWQVTVDRHMTKALAAIVLDKDTLRFKWTYWHLNHDVRHFPDIFRPFDALQFQFKDVSRQSLTLWSLGKRHEKGRNNTLELQIGGNEVRLSWIIQTPDNDFYFRVFSKTKVWKSICRWRTSDKQEQKLSIKAHTRLRKSPLNLKSSWSFSLLCCIKNVG